MQRNQALQLKNHRERMLLAKARGELVEKRLVELQASYLLIAMRQRMLAVPQAYAGRLLGLADAHEASQILRQAMIECLDELKDLPARVTDASWIERVVEEQGAGGAPSKFSATSAPTLPFRFFTICCSTRKMPRLPKIAIAEADKYAKVIVDTAASLTGGGSCLSSMPSSAIAKDRSASG